MATDLERMVVQLSADVRRYETALKRAQGQTNKAARGIETRFRRMNKNIATSLTQSLARPLAAIGSGLAVRAVKGYADAWLDAGNKIAAAGSVAGRQGRSLEGINEIARRTRSSFTDTVDLYARVLRSSADVAKSEEEVARVTETVAKAFKAGGATAQEASAGIIQFGQALGSSLLAGDELRSIRENAPLLAKAIAEEFKTTVGGLKELGAAGELTSERVFKAVLAGQKKIETAFATTRSTISDAITAVNNAMTEYVGQSDASLGASRRLIAGLTALADNFDKVADTTLALAGIIAGALIGRSLAVMIAKVPAASAAILALAVAFNKAKAAGGGLVALRTVLLGTSAAAGPLGLAIGAAVTALLLLDTQSATAAARTDRVNQALAQMGIDANAAATGIEKVSGEIDKLAAEDRIRLLRELNDELRRMGRGEGFGFIESVFGGAREKSLTGIISDLRQFDELRRRVLKTEGGLIDEVTRKKIESDRATVQSLENLIKRFDAGELSAQEVGAKLDEIAKIGISEPIEEFIRRVREAVGAVAALRQGIEEVGETPVGPRVPLDPGIRSRFLEQRKSEFFSERNIEAARSKLEKEIIALAATIKKEAAVLGITITDAAARLQAESEIAARNFGTTISKFVDHVVQAESGGRSDAKNPLSTATGLGQFIESTWLQLFKENFPDRAKGLSDAVILALRTDAQTSRQLIEAYARDNAAVLQRAGVSVDEAALQLAHFLGPGGAIKVLQAAPGTPVQGLLDQAAINANPSILGGGATVDDLIRYAQARAGLTGEIRRQKTATDDLIGSQEQENEGLRVEQQAMQLATFEAEKLRKETELLNELRRQGVTITPEIAAAVSQLATEYAKERVAIEGIAEAQKQAAKAAEQLADAQRKAAEMGKQLEQAFSGAVKGFISDIIHGKSVTEALTNALTRLADQLISMALDNLFSGMFSGKGGLFGSVLHGGGIAGSSGSSRRVSGAAFLGAPRYHTGGVAGLKPGEIPAILQRGEPVGPAAVDAAARRLIALGGAGRDRDNRRRGNVTVVNHFNTPEIASARSQNQMAARAADSLRRASRTA
jgi:tape measure domain-containing protein